MLAIEPPKKTNTARVSIYIIYASFTITSLILVYLEKNKTVDTTFIFDLLLGILTVISLALIFFKINIFIDFAIMCSSLILWIPLIIISSLEYEIISLRDFGSIFLFMLITKTIAFITLFCLNVSRYKDS